MSPSTAGSSPCRLIDDPPAIGAWQMAVDEALLESAATSGVCSLRFYQWSEPTLSLGYFQAHAERASHAASRDCALVRRQTGGGAILHDRELTYSLAIPIAHPLAQDSAGLYSAVHQALIRVLANWEIEASLCGQDALRKPLLEPFLCFARRTPGDVLLGEAKICGSAQRRRRGAVLQHGSLLLARSPCAPELAGIAELAGRSLAPAELAVLWQSELADRLGLKLRPQGLFPAETELARRLALEKYAAAAWNARR